MKPSFSHPDIQTPARILVLANSVLKSSANSLVLRLEINHAIGLSAYINFYTFFCSAKCLSSLATMLRIKLYCKPNLLYDRNQFAEINTIARHERKK